MAFNDSPQQMAAGEEIVDGADGKSWRLSHLTPGVRLAISRWAKREVRQQLRDQLEWQSVSENKADVALFQAQCAAGEYDWGPPTDPKGFGQQLQAMIQTSGGQLMLLRELLRPAHGELTDAQLVELDKADPEQVVAAVRRCLGLDPNPQTPVTPTTTPGTTTAAVAPTPTV